MQIIKRIITYFRLLFMPTVPIDKSNEETTNTILSPITQDKLVDGVQKESTWFARANNLIQEFQGEPPIVYEADMVTVKASSQYGYTGDSTIEKEELLMNDVELLKKREDFATPDLEKSITTNFGTDNDYFKERWEEIKRKLREDDTVDGVIKE